MFGQEEEVYGALTFYRELSYFLCRRKQYERALVYFNEACLKNPTDKRALIGRSSARAKVCKYNGALADIAKALEEDPEDLIALAHKTLNLYLCCRFEDALIFNQRMMIKRKQPDSFVMGTMQCSVAIENCIGNRAGRPLRDHFKVIRKLAWQQNHENLKPFHFKSERKVKRWKKQMTKRRMIEPVVPFIRTRVAKLKGTPKSTLTACSLMSKEAQEFVGMNEEQAEISKNVVALLAKQKPDLLAADEGLNIVDSLETSKPPSLIIPSYGFFPYNPAQKYTTNLENYMCEKYLDSMFNDKAFMKYLYRHPGVLSPNKQGAAAIVKMGNEGYKTMCFKQELLRTRKPFYHIKHQEAQLSPAIKGRMLEELMKIQNACKKDADKLISNLKELVEAKKIRTALEVAEKLRVFCELKPKKHLPNQQEYLHMMYKLVSRAYFENIRLGPNYFLNEKRLLFWLGRPIVRTNSTDSVLDEFKDYYVDWKKGILVYEDRLRKAITSEEMAWCYYELSRHHTAVKQHELARAYARKCILEAIDCLNVDWIVNAMLLLAKNHLMQFNRNDTKVQILEIINIAALINDDNLDDVLHRMLDVVDGMEAEEDQGLSVLYKRQNQIIQMMASATAKSEVAHLFRKMAAMPGNRRMSVMPGVRLDMISDKKPVTASSRKMSILPQSKEADEPESGKKKGNRASKDESPDVAVGAKFYELIKYHVD